MSDQIPPTPPASSYPPTEPSRGPHYRAPLMAAFLSIMPGLGNIYNGLYQRGVTFFLIVVGIFGIAVESGEGPHLGFLIPALGFSWFFNIFDAYRQATLINYGYTDATLPKAPKQSASGGLMLGVAVFLIGLYGFLREVLDIDFSAILEYWFLGFMAFGGWLIYQGLKKANGTDPDSDTPTAFEVSEEETSSSEAA